jgi:hypothetical protein
MRDYSKLSPGPTVVQEKPSAYAYLCVHCCARMDTQTEADRHKLLHPAHKIAGQRKVVL